MDGPLALSSFHVELGEGAGGYHLATQNASFLTKSSKRSETSVIVVIWKGFRRVVCVEEGGGCVWGVNSLNEWVITPDIPFCFLTMRFASSFSTRVLSKPDERCWALAVTRFLSHSLKSPKSACVKGRFKDSGGFDSSLVGPGSRFRAVWHSTHAQKLDLSISAITDCGAEWFPPDSMYSVESNAIVEGGWCGGDVPGSRG